MRIRIRFARNERVKFLGHLDIMRSFQRAFNRAGVAMIYSEGYSPHQKMNFAQPLGVGVLSSGDYLDAEIEDGQDIGAVREALSEQMGEGFEVLSCGILEENAEKCMAAVRYASYIITVNEGAVPSISQFTEAEQVIASKKTKSGEKDTDIRPLVISMESCGNDITMIVCAGSNNNLKPELVMQVLCSQCGITYERSSFSVRRLELYAEGYIPLSSYQTVSNE